MHTTKLLTRIQSLIVRPQLLPVLNKPYSQSRCSRTVFPRRLTQGSCICDNQSTCLRRCIAPTTGSQFENKIDLHSFSQLQFRLFHTSSRRNIPPVVWVIIKPVVKVIAALGGRHARNRYRALDSKEKFAVQASLKKYWYVWTGALCLVVGSIGWYWASHIQVTPITGRKRFMALTSDQILAIADAESKQLREQFSADKFYKIDDPAFGRVLNVTAKIIQDNEVFKNSRLKTWVLYVVKDEAINASVLPNGHVYIFDGMLRTASTDDQLAVVIGHELAHALLEHGIEELSYGQLLDTVVIGLLAAIWCVLPFDGIALVTQWFQNKVIKLLKELPHSREIEKEADKVGLMLAAKACYDTRAGSLLWNKMQVLENLGEIPYMPAYLSTHPQNLKRAEHLDFLQEQAMEWRQEKKCPPLPKDDPRKAIETLAKFADNQKLAKLAGQNLSRVHKYTLPGSKASDAS